MFGKPLLFAGTSDPGAGSYNIGRSLRFDKVDDKLTQALGAVTPTGIGKFSISLWAKISDLTAAARTIFSAANGGNYDRFGLTSAHELQIVNGSDSGYAKTTAVFRDPCSHYHILFVVDLSKVQSLRGQIYVNGVNQVLSNTSLTTTNFAFNNASLTRYIGILANNTDEMFGGYLSEIHFLDGVAATPDMFGYKNEITGQWLPKAYTGTASSYGNNGFYLPFSDTTSTTTLGYDQATVTGLHDSANNWTPSGGLSRTAGVDDCSVIDTPTNNFCTVNPIALAGTDWSGTTTLGKGALQSTHPNGTYNSPAYGTIAVPSGTKVYFEVEATTVNNEMYIGVGSSDLKYGTLTARTYARSNGNKYNGSSSVAYGNSYTTGDIIGVAVDLANGAIWFSKNGTWQNTATQAEISAGTTTNAAYTDLNSLANNSWFPLQLTLSSSVLTHNYGQYQFHASASYYSSVGGYFRYEPPTGYRALCTQNLPQPTIHNPKLHFDVKTYTGNGGNLQVGEIAKAQDLVVIDKSLRFRDENSAYLSKTLNTTGNRQIWTWSGWVKRSEVGSGVYTLFSAGPGSNTDYFFLAYNYSGNDDKIVVLDIGGASSIDLRSTSLQRNTSSFMHVVLAVDTTQGTASNKVKVYVDGVRITSFSTETYPGVLDTRVNYNGHLHYIGAARFLATSCYFSGYLSDVYFVDGLALLPSDFGQTDGNGYWVPRAYTISSGNNSFHLEFEDTTGTTPATLGKDTSGVNVISGQTCTTNGTTSVTAITGTTQPQVNMVVTGGDFATGTYITAVGGSSGSWNCTLSTAATGSHTSHAVTFTGNNWGMSGFSVTEGADYDSVVDTPTNTYATLDAVENNLRGSMTLNDGGLEWTNTSGGTSGGCPSTLKIPPGAKIYFEFVPTTIAAESVVGIAEITANWATISGPSAADTWMWSGSPGYYYDQNASSNPLTGKTTWTANTVHMVAYDGITGKMWFGKGGTWNEGDPADTAGTCSLQVDTPQLPKEVFVLGYSSPVIVMNFGQRPFTTDTSTDWRSAAGGYFRYDPPTGYKALSENNISEYLYDVEKPDVVWIKNRDQTDSHMLFDSVRGVGKYIKTDPDTSESEATDVNSLIQFNKNGFYLGNMNEVNTINEKYVAWLWKGAGGQASWNFDGDLTRTCTISLATPGVVTLASNGFENGQAVKFTTTGTLPSGLSPSTTYYVVNVASTTFSVAATVGGTAINTTSAGSGTHTCEHATKVCSNPTAGISVVQYAGHGTAGKTYGHGLTVKPSFILIKRLLAASDWRVYHSAQGATKYAAINSSAAFSTNSTVWNDVEPTSSVFTLGSDGSVNWADYRYIAYCFAEVPGFSKFGSYTGNGSSDGPFIYCGFRPRWIMARTVTTTASWLIIDASRSNYNVSSASLFADTYDLESSATVRLDILSNGFKIRDSNSVINNANTCIFIAFAETPFKYANAR